MWIMKARTSLAIYNVKRVQWLDLLCSYDIFEVTCFWGHHQLLFWKAVGGLYIQKTKKMFKRSVLLAKVARSSGIGTIDI